MKKLLATLMALLMCGSLVACSNGNGQSTGGGSTFNTSELVEATSREVQTLDYNVTALATDHELNANFVDGLLEIDNYGHIVGALAESWEANEDKTQWTFHIRQGVNWVNNNGEVYDELKAEDFVTGIRHGAEFDSGTAWLLQGVIKGYTEYQLTKDWSDEAWANVGVKAVDDYTLVFDMEVPVPYFETMTTYAVLFPINRQFLESKGTGCALGAPNKEECAYGTAAPDSILYNGGFLLSVFDAKSSTVLVKNENYWDKDNVFVDKVTRIFDDGSDPYSGIKGFEQGIYARAGLNPSWSDYEDYAEKYAENGVAEEPNASVFGVVFNYNRQVYNETNHKDDASKQNTYNAIQNENFRKALRAAFDKQAYNEIGVTTEVAIASLRNINNYPEIVTNSEGKLYVDLVTEAYQAATGETRDLSDGADPFFSKEEALAYIEAAKAEGITFPVHLDMLVTETSDKLVKQAQSMKKSVEDNTDGQIVIELIMRDKDTVESIAYYNTDPALADYDISTFTGWSPDYADPKSYVDIYSPTTGYYMTSCGLQTGAYEEVTDYEIKEKIGLVEYEELYRAADEITTDMDARYEAFAKTDAYLIERAIFIPSQQQSRAFRVSREVPFTRPYSHTGISEYKYKYLKLQEDLVTVDQYNQAREAWEAAR